jgi:hypothetical protein
LPSTISKVLHHNDSSLNFQCFVYSVSSCGLALIQCVSIHNANIPSLLYLISY